jgi:hypothetical protein
MVESTSLVFIATMAIDQNISAEGVLGICEVVGRVRL